MSRAIPLTANRQPLGQLNFSKTLSAPVPNWVQASLQMLKLVQELKKRGSTYEMRN
jgi:hypothetical protein